jgi:predicted transcriptional regulator of viral defense system
VSYLEFREALLPFAIFSLRDIIKLFPGFDTRRLVEWQHKGYISKLVNKWYLFSEVPLDEMTLFRISNCIYRPSYISLESALSYYHLIPEAVYSHQAITTRKTIVYKTPAGVFNYHSVKPEFFFGYHILYDKELPVLVAGIEKALIDYLYFDAGLKTSDDVEAVRFNYTGLQNKIDWNKLENYASLFENKTLNKRINYLKKLVLHANPS